MKEKQHIRERENHNEEEEIKLSFMNQNNAPIIFSIRFDVLSLFMFRSCSKCNAENACSRCF